MPRLTASQQCIGSRLQQSAPKEFPGVFDVRDRIDRCALGSCQARVCGLVSRCLLLIVDIGDACRSSVVLGSGFGQVLRFIKEPCERCERKGPRQAKV